MAGRTWGGFYSPPGKTSINNKGREAIRPVLVKLCNIYQLRLTTSYDVGAAQAREQGSTGAVALGQNVREVAGRCLE